MTTRVSVVIFAQNYAPEPSGNAPYVASLAEGLERSGDFSVTVVTAHPYYPEWKIQDGYGQWSRDEVLNRVSLRRKRHYVPRHPTSLRRLLSEVSFGVRSVVTHWVRADVIVLVSPSLFAAAITMLRAKLTRRRTPVLTWVQDLYSLGVMETGGSRAIARVVTLVERWLLERSDAVIVIHDRFRASVTDVLRVRSPQVDVIRNWTHIEPADAQHRHRAREQRGWRPDEIVALHTGNMGIKQGLETVVEAASLADREGVAVRFVLLGGGNQRERLIELGAPIERLEFVDSLSDAEYALALVAADVLLVCERPGVSGMAVPSKLTSYFASGRPVVASTDTGGVTSEEIRAAGAGVCTPAGDAGALLSAVVSVGSNRDAAEKFGAAGVRYYKDVLSERAALDAFAARLRQASSGPAPHPGD